MLTTNKRPVHSFRLDPENPAFALMRAKRGDVLSTRRALFALLDGASPKASDVLRRFCSMSIGRRSIPHLGEMLPWIMADLGGTRKESVKPVAVGWLALYLYALIVDQRADERQRLDSEEQLASTLLLSIGLRELYRVVSGTEFEAVFTRHLADAIDGQLADLSHQREAGSTDREHYTVSKNSGLVCGAAAIAAVSPPRGASIVPFMERIRLAFQFLDDLADWRADARAGNHTMLLADVLGFNRARRGDNRELRRIDEGHLVCLMIESGSLLGIVSRIDECLLEQEQLCLGPLAASPSHVFFKSLRRRVQDVIRAVEAADLQLKTAVPAQRRVIANRIEKVLTIVAQTT